ncbi:hypothetical protein ASU31_10375 [Pedobacter ginsenosidimutans]|uniref:Cyclic nucleotide-binding domain-containing protein n=1 Tax=Pedobacter ginsenosidimutans TaxID=687842 RepID=A0A0T5VQT9_9SPHI|nr:Crp/Fnr family transcriptional regulator [Pedobacter ginsenosidimutans]KRT15908.1 hypothetical protein ASU31_10375 [Pedobacter ginsenosidimutans]
MDQRLQPNPIKPVSDESFDTIIGVMDSFTNLSRAFKAKLRPMLFEITYKKGYMILNPGAKQSLLWFNLDGLLREVSIDRNTYQSQTTWYWFKTNFVYAMPGFFDQEPSQVSIEVIKDTRAILFSYDSWRILKNSFEEADRMIEMIRSSYETARKTHLKEIIELDTITRYLRHESKINLLFPNIKLKYIAEYMGMSTDTLGKLRRKFIRRKQLAK